MADEKKPARKAPPTPKPDLIGAYIKEHMRMELKRGDFTNPNGRTIVLLLKDEEFASVSFDVVQKREYEG